MTYKTWVARPVEEGLYECCPMEDNGLVVLGLTFLCGLACLLERGAERIIQVEDMYTRKGARLIWPEEEQA